MYMDLQPSVNERKRAIFVDWIIDVNRRLRLADETLYLAVNIMDRYLEWKVLRRNKFHILVAACLFIAAKFVDRRSRSPIQTFVDISGNVFSKRQLIEMETHILMTLKYKVYVPTPYTFLVRFLKVAWLSQDSCIVARLILERTLLSYELLLYPPSQLASAAIAIARHSKGNYPWSPALRVETGYSEQEVISVAHAVRGAYESTPPACLDAVTRKYKSLLDLNVALSRTMVYV